MSVRFVAEVSSNHHRDLERCLELVDAAAAAGRAAVKFQLFKIDKLFSPQALSFSGELCAREQWEHGDAGRGPGRAVSVSREAGCRGLSLLHFVSSYPAPPEQCNLAAIKTLRDACDCPVGWSDHSVDPAVLVRAAFKWDASMIEFHLDLEGEGEEFGASAKILETY